MTQENNQDDRERDWTDDLQDAVDDYGQSEVARRLGCSPATVHQLRTGQYGASTVAQWKARFRAEFGEGMVECPVLGEITREQCSMHRKRDFAATNPLRVRLFHACKTCKNNPDAQ